MKKRYEKYKESEIQWLGIIPEHWKSVKIRRLTSVNRGASPRPIDDPIYFDDNGEYGWVRIKDVTASERYLTQTEEKLSELGATRSVKLEPGQLFLSIAGSVGKPIINKVKCCIHDGFVYFPRLKINPEYLYYIFTTGELYKGLGKLGTQLNLNTDTVGDIVIPIPTESEIELIVKFLDYKCTIIDDLISKKERLIERLQELRQATINEAVTKGLDPKTKMRDSGVEWLGNVPKNWTAIKLKWIANIYAGGTPSTTVDEYWINGDIPWLNSGSVNQRRINIASAYITKEALVNSSTKWVPKDSLLMALAGQGKTKGTVAILDFDATCNQSMAAIVPNRDKINTEFLYFWLHSKYERIRGLAGTEQRDGLNLEIIGDIFCPVPPIKEQISISAYLTKSDINYESLINRNADQIEKLKEYRQSLISEVVTGKIDVRDWQPSN